MTRESCDKVLATIASQPWAILPEALDQIIAIASRGWSDPEAALAKRAERGDPGAADRRAATAIIPIFGPIFPRADYFSEVSGATSVSGIARMLDHALADPDVAAIVLNIDSPGGQVTGVRELADKIFEADKVKPVTAYVSGMAASAAYWLASAARQIVAERTATAGSIGVLCAWTDDSAAKKSQGLRDYVVVSSQTPKKHVDPKSREGLGELQHHVDVLADIFIGDVAAYRGVATDVVMRDFGEGRVILAEEALPVGLIDAIGTLDNAIESAAAARLPAPVQTKGNAMKVLTNPAAGRPPKRRSEDDKPEDDEKDEEAKAKNRRAETEDEDEPRDDDALEDPDEEEDEADEEEDDEETKAKNRKAAKRAKAQNPTVFKLAYQAGVRAERARIQAIHQLKLVGQEKLVERAMFTKPMSAAALALAVVQDEQSRRRVMSAARLKESEDIKVGADLLGTTALDGDAAAEKAIIDAMAGKIPLV